MSVNVTRLSRGTRSQIRLRRQIEVRPGPGYGCIITVTGGLPGKNNVPVLLLLGINIPGAPPPRGATVACLPWLEVTVPVKP